MVVCKAMLALRNPAVNAVPPNKMLIISLHINVRRTSVSLADLQHGFNQWDGLTLPYVWEHAFLLNMDGKLTLVNVILPSDGGKLA